MSARHDHKRADALLEKLIPLMRDVVAEHLAPAPVRPLTMPAVDPSDLEVVDDVTRHRARVILERAGLAQRGRR